MKVQTKVFNGWKVSFINEIEVKDVLNELLVHREYEVKIGKSNPVIMDVGANIGLATLYFKQLYPESKIMAFEPNPQTYQLLVKNIKQNKLSNISTFNVAVTKEESEVDFYVYSSRRDIPWSIGDSLMKSSINLWQKDFLSNTVKVKTIKLSRYINSSVDLLKIDIEGSETDVLVEIEDKLKLIENIVLEYHRDQNNPNNKMETIVEILARNRFEYWVRMVWFPIPKQFVLAVVNLLTLLKISWFTMQIKALKVS